MSLVSGPKNKNKKSCIWQHVKAVKDGNNCAVNKWVMTLMIVSAFKAATGYKAHLEEHCNLTKWAGSSDPWHGTGMLTHSAICSLLLPSGSVMLPYSENTPGEQHQFPSKTNPNLQTCAQRHTFLLEIWPNASVNAKCIYCMMPIHRVCCRSNLFWNWQMWLMLVFLTAEFFYDAWKTKGSE